MCWLTQRKLRRHVLRESRRRDPQAGHEYGEKPAKVTAMPHAQTLTLSRIENNRLSNLNVVRTKRLAEFDAATASEAASPSGRRGEPREARKDDASLNYIGDLR
jgi:hypothetical protein